MELQNRKKKTILYFNYYLGIIMYLIMYAYKAFLEKFGINY